MKNSELSSLKTSSWKTREVLIGKVGVGGSNPIRIQSMTTSSTRDVLATIEQVKRLADSGCEIARVTVQGMKEVEACEAIKNGLIQQGYTIPLVADIHFFPPAALSVVDFVEKVRVNPGNFVDKRASFKVIEYDDVSYAKEIEKIEEKFTPLVEKCKRLKRAMRIGTNHGSLSDRIMNRYGDTPKGMVESALEFARICRNRDYHDFLFSMKSSNPQVMIGAYRLLVAEMIALGWNYPLHLGVTEAGEGEDGRIKSAIGIGSLLLDGIGDTIRVSLTEDAWNEIDPCKRLIAFREASKTGSDEALDLTRSFQKRPVIFPKNVGLHRDGTVILSASTNDVESIDFTKKIGCMGEKENLKLTISSADGLVIKEKGVPETYQKLKNLKEIGLSIFSKKPFQEEIPLLSLEEFHNHPIAKNRLHLFTTPSSPIGIIIGDEPSIEWALIERIKPTLIFLSPSKNRVHTSRQFFLWLEQKKIDVPVILSFSYSCSKEDLIIHSATELGSLLCDGLGEGIWIQGPYDIEFLRTLSFNILQAVRMRSFKTDFISCPSCGRTLFDLQEVSKRIRSKTAHLPGVKIAIMGCIVNGPGEMVGADFGYVGSKPGKIDLYRGKECVEKDIAFEDADDRLIDLIKKTGRWVEPSATASLN